jgi:hypothetical protein
MSACYGLLGRWRTSTDVTEGSAYRKLLLALIDAEKTDKAANGQDRLGLTG